MRPLDLDRRLLLLARTRGHGPRRDRAIASFSRLGEHAACWLALGAAGAALDRERRPAWQRATGLVATSYALNYAVKVTVGRPRPALDGLPPLVHTVSRLSFPSAHATTSFAAAGLYRGIAPMPAALYAVAAAFGVSRPYLGVHYPTDILAGALLGAAFAATFDGACR